MGNWTTDGNEINNRPIYKKGTFNMAAMTVPTGYIPSWVVTFEAPGSANGYMFSGSNAPKCPHAVSSWLYYSQSTRDWEEDDSLTVTCGSSECLQYPHHQH